MATEIMFDQERAIELFSLLVERYREKRPPFDRLVLPEYQCLPEGIGLGSREHMLFLFFAAWLSRSGNRASQVYAIAAEFCTRFPYLIDPAAALSESEVRAELLEIDLIPQPGKNSGKTSAVDWWIDTRIRLREQYGSDPCQLFENLPTDNGWKMAQIELLRRLEEFRGVGPKIAALMVSHFQQLILPVDTDYWRFVQRIPVFTADVHTMRLLYMNGIITGYQSDRIVDLTGPISEFVCQLCYDHALPHSALLEALWLVGSKVCDTMRRLGDKGRPYCYATCPLVSSCRGVVPVNTVHSKKGTQAPEWHGWLHFDDMVPHADLS